MPLWGKRKNIVYRGDKDRENHGPALYRKKLLPQGISTCSDKDHMKAQNRGLSFFPCETSHTFWRMHFAYFLREYMATQQIVLDVNKPDFSESNTVDTF